MCNHRIAANVETKKTLLFFATEIQSCICFYVDVAIPNDESWSLFHWCYSWIDEEKDGWMDGSVERLMSLVVGYDLLLDCTCLFLGLLYRMLQND